MLHDYIIKSEAELRWGFWRKDIRFILTDKQKENGYMKKEQELKAIVVLKINVGHLPPHKVDAYMKNTIKKCSGSKTDGIVQYFIPTRSEQTSIEVHTL